MYTVETERRYGVRENEHDMDVRSLEEEGLRLGNAPFSNHTSCRQKQPHDTMGGSEIPQ